MNELTKLAHKYKTDKVDQYHTFLGETYTDVYYKYLNHLREEEFNFLEIGVREGASIKMWSEFFPNAKIVGIDIDPNCKQYEGGNVEIRIGSQEDETFLKGLISEYGSFRVVLDDGSHINSMIMESFKVLQSYTTELYMIEDLRNSYEDLTQDVRMWPGMHLNENLDANNARTRPLFNELMMDLIKQMDYRMGRWSGFCFHAQMLIMQKGSI